MCLQESGWSKSCQLSSQIHPPLDHFWPPDSGHRNPDHCTPHLECYPLIVTLALLYRTHIIIFNIWLIWFHSPAQHRLMVSSHTQIQSKLLHMDCAVHKIWTLPSFQTFFLPPIPYFIGSKHQLPHGRGINDIHFCGCGPRYFLFPRDYSSSHLLGIVPHLIQVYNQTSRYQLCYSKATI